MNIAWIGLGNMGRPMVRNLVKAGYPVRGFDLSQEACRAAAEDGAQIAASVADAVAGADLVVTMLPRAVHVAAVLEGEGGVLASAEPGTILMDCSTIDVASAERFHALAEERGFPCLDAPVSGGVSGADAGTLTMMVGGDADTVERVRPVLEVVGGRIFHLGGAGRGQAAKIVNNMMLAISVAAVSEGAALADHLGLDHRAFYDLASTSSGDSWALRTWYPVAGVSPTSAANDGFRPGFSIALLAKDVGLALAAGKQTGTSLRYAQRVADDLDELIERGDADRDSSYFVSLVDEELAERGMHGERAA